MKVLVTCPPMLGMINEFAKLFTSLGMEITAPQVVQTLSVEELIKIVPLHDGWIIGDDSANREVFHAGKNGKLKAAIKWGIGVDNVDFDACKEFGIPITNTPNMFGNEVADVAVGYVIGLARETFFIHQQVLGGEWPKPRGISLNGKVAAVVGFGDIGTNIAKRLISFGMKVNAYDPSIKEPSLKNKNFQLKSWPEDIDHADFIILCCALTSSSKYILQKSIFQNLKKGVRIVNVGRGPLINEEDLEKALQDQIVHSVALDVFEKEPLPKNSYLRSHNKCIFGSHNASNTKEAVIKTSEVAINKLYEFINEKS